MRSREEGRRLEPRASWTRRTGKRLLRLIPQIDRLYRRVETLGTLWNPPGHFYSPIPDIEAVRKREDVIFGAPPESLPAIDLNEEGQLRLLKELTPFALDQPFSASAEDGLRYHYGNGVFDYADGLLAHCMIRWARPSRIVEVGSGHSSGAILDTVERFVDHDVKCTFIDPYPEALRRQLLPGDEGRITILAEPVQEVDLDMFRQLGAGDLLFIDSSHVSKVDSDVNHLIFEVLPRLATGVLLNVHDMFFPFEYRKEWVFEGRAWTEAYMLRAFMQYNTAFEIRLFFDYLRQLHWDALEPLLPSWWEMSGWALGSSFWMEKVAEREPDAPLRDR